MPYRVALLVDSLELPEPVRDLAEWASAETGIELVALLVQASAPGGCSADRSRSWHWIFSGMLHRATMALESRLAGRSRASREAAAGQAMRCAPPSLEVRAAGYSDAHRAAFLDADIEAVRALGLDAIICCAGEVPGGEMLAAARDGAIWIRFGAASAGFAGPAGFREVLDGEPLTRFAILRSAGEGHFILFDGSVATDLFYTRHRAALYRRAGQYLRQSIGRLAAGGAGAARPDSSAPDALPLNRPPPVADSVRYAARTAVRVYRKALRKALGKEWNFGVAYSFQPWRTAALDEGILLPAPAGTFLADPFGFVAEDRHYIFAEEFPFATRKGVISVFEVRRDGATRLGVALEEPYHLSFPFIFRAGGAIYMVPEGNADRTIKLYRCDRFPDRWSHCKTLLEGVSAVDTILFEHGRRWWMLTTIQGEGGAANNAELHAFHADDLLGDWTAHAGNPVVMDASRGRNGGMVDDGDGQIYRVAQRSGFDSYGTGCAVYRVEQLTPEAYRESLVQEVESKFFSRLVGNHHLHAREGFTVYDFCRDERPPRAPAGAP